MELKKLMGHISIIPDYRQAWKVEHKLSDILLLTICAVISGAEGWAYTLSEPPGPKGSTS
ncbi:transposase family protein, partial [Escherichia coli]|uniref:transposase family protein n=1 Tax=Escherichia coli TaxID=562 RepID=UPI003CFE9057